MPEYTQGGYSLRRLLPAEWPLFKAIRLTALAATPGVYGSSLDKESVFTDALWQSGLEADSSAFWGLFYEDELIGLTGIVGDAGHPAQAKLIASFIQPAHRGKGLAALFYHARLDWARDKKLQRLIVSHRAGNIASQKANQRAGFVHTHTESQLWPDGQEAAHLFYVKPLGEIIKTS